MSKWVLLSVAIGVVVIGGYMMVVANKQAPCGIENCHGLTFTCGDSVPDACDASYQIGDKCRQHNPCEVVDGTCKVVANAKFEACKSCVESCYDKFPNDPEAQFTCESSCE